YREQHPLELARPRPPQADRWQPVAADRLYARLNEPEPRDRESPPLPINPPQTREINLRDRPARPVALRHTRMVVTVRELDDL
ncbi:AraC family transcriptional regulator, partial [Klebsiella pneumoniae]|nr:AraC family transcriptional regulator [Klebsiella pneumoniae]